MNWKLIPLPTLILLLCLAGVIRIREQGGEGDGFLLAGAGLVLAGIWSAMEVLSRGKAEGLGDRNSIQERVSEAVVKRVIDKTAPKTTDVPEVEGEPPTTGGTGPKS